MKLRWSDLRKYLKLFYINSHQLNVGLEIWRMVQNKRITGNSHSIYRALKSTQLGLLNSRVLGEGRTYWSENFNFGQKSIHKNITLIRIPESPILLEFLLPRWSQRNWGGALHYGIQCWSNFWGFVKTFFHLHKHFQSSVDVFCSLDSSRWILSDLVFGQFRQRISFSQGGQKPVKAATETPHLDHCQQIVLHHLKRSEQMYLSLIC